MAQVDTLLIKIGGTLDLTKGYQQIPLAKANR